MLDSWSVWPYNGVMEKLTVRLPKELRERIRKVAEKNRRSLNAEILVLLEEALKRRRG